MIQHYGADGAGNHGEGFGAGSAGHAVPSEAEGKGAAAGDPRILSPAAAASLGLGVSEGGASDGVRTRVGGPRTACTEVLDHLAPAGCRFRRYDPTGSRAPYYKGELPAGKHDDSGHRSHSCGWGFYAGRGVEEATWEVQTWLSTWGS